MMSPEEVAARAIVRRHMYREFEPEEGRNASPAEFAAYKDIVAALRAERPSSEELAAPAAPREREKTFEDGIEAAAKLVEDEYMDYTIARNIRALAASTSGGK